MGTGISIVISGVSGHGAYTVLWLLHLQENLGVSGVQKGVRLPPTPYPLTGKTGRKEETARADPTGRPRLSPEVRAQGRVRLDHEDISKMMRRVKNALAKDQGTGE